MVTTATPRPTAEHDESVQRQRIVPPVETVRPVEPDRDPLEHRGSRGPLRGILFAAPVGAGLWALIIGLVRVALS